MVRNTQGGNKSKGMARKHLSKGNNNSKLRVPTEAGEELACVTKLYGNGMCEVYNNENEKLIGHIRGSMRGRQKRHNTISASCLVLIGLREWESTKKNCDILCIYNEEEINQLKNIPNVHINNIMDIRNNSMGISKETADFVTFEEEKNDIKIINKDIQLENFELKENIIDLDDI